MLGVENTESNKKKLPKDYNYHGVLFILISGVGGVGKTALAQAVYNNSDVKQTFASKACWISVSSSFGVKLLMQKILNYMNKKKRYKPIPPLESTSLEEISQKLSSSIQGVRFLIVLDGMPVKDENGWDILYKFLSLGAPGSVVLVTTHDQIFANKVAEVASIHVPLGPLETATFWKLFKHFAFGDIPLSDVERKNFELIGKTIADKLRGLPLAAKIIGKRLRSNFNQDRWENISKSEWWDMCEDLRSKILPSIALCYEYLDPLERQCFAYCSLFPRNSLIDKDRLVQMWIAQNYVTYTHVTHHGDRLEDIGRQWFDKLVEMSFFQPAQDNNSSYFQHELWDNSYFQHELWDNDSSYFQHEPWDNDSSFSKWDNKFYVMPTLMHDLAIVVSSGDCFYVSDDLRIPEGVHHIAVDTMNLGQIQEIQKLKHLRSFLFFGFCVEGMYETINKTLDELKSLRVLDLSYLNMVKSKTPPPSIQSSTHLRFLDLSYTGIEVLTHNSSFNHYHLQALHIQGCKLREFPREMNKLFNLRHLNCDADTVAQIPNIGQLTNLQELNEYRVDITKKGHKITELNNLREITGRLQIKNCGKIKSKNEAMEANLDDKKHLDSIGLSFSFHNDTNREPGRDMEILEGLKPGDDIKELTISKYKGLSFPDSWLKNCNFQNLQNLHLNSCWNIESLPLQKFAPYLSSLRVAFNESLNEVPLDHLGASLRAFKIIKSPLTSLKSYPKSTACLTYLQIVEVEVNISLNIENLRLLEHLVLEDCPNLIILGDLQSLTNLKWLIVIGCGLLRSSLHYMMSNKKKGLEMDTEGLQSLSHLAMDQTLWEFRELLGRLPSLRVLRFRGLGQAQLIEDAPLWYQNLSTLRELHFDGVRLKHLPSSLHTLSSLQEMSLLSCHSVDSLPVECMPPNLLKLTLGNCNSYLERRCMPFIGVDWEHISHIPLIQIDDRIIRKFTSDEGEFWKLKKGSED